MPIVFEKIVWTGKITYLQSVILVIMLLLLGILFISMNSKECMYCDFKIYGSA